MNIVFEWDENKDRLNFEKHKISFSIAAKVFENKCFVYTSVRERVHEALKYAMSPLEKHLGKYYL